MLGYRFINRMVQGWQDKPWMQLSDTCPYWLGHRKTTHHPEFVKESLFRLYCSGSRRPLARGSRQSQPRRGGSDYRHGKLYKLYWALHVQPTATGGHE